jgi:hypothetical protein
VRRALLAACGCLALLRPAAVSADVPVVDAQALIAHAKELVQDIKGYVLQIQQYTTELQQLASLEVQIQSTIQHPSLGAAAGLMGRFGIQDPLDGLPSIYSVMALTSGLGSGQGLQSIASRIAGLNAIFSSMGTVNKIYDCTDQSFACQQQQQAARANAGYQGIIGQIYTQLQNHLNITNALRDNLATSTDPAQRENAIAQLTAEQNWATTAIGQLQSATALYQAQRQANADRDDERLNQDIDAILAHVPKG